MSVVVTQSPDDIALAKNQVLYKAQTDEYITNAGSPFSKAIALSGVPADGDTLVLDFKDLTFTYTFKTVPADRFDVDRSSGILITVQQELYNRINENYYIHLYYALSFPFSVITLVAHEPGTEFNMTISGSAPYFLTGSNGTDPVVRSDFRLYWDVYDASDVSIPVWEKVISQDLIPDNNQFINPDVAELLRSVLSPDVPAFGATAVSYNANSLRKFLIRHGEYYDDEVHLYFTEPAKKVMLAGIAIDKWPFITFLNDYGFSADGQKWLTNQPRLQVIDKAAQTYLCCLVDSDFVVKADFFWNDDTSTTETLFSVAGNSKTWALIPTGWNALNMDSFIPGGVDYPLHYEVYIEQNTFASEKFAFELDLNNYINPRYLVFHNSLNGWDTIWCTGDQNRLLETVGEDYDGPVSRDMKPVAVENNIVEASTKSDHPIQQRFFEMNTGYKARNYVQALARELALSEKILLVDAGRWIEVKIDRGSIKEIDGDADDLWALSFKYELGFQDLAF